MAIRPRALHHQVAEEMRRNIKRGRWTPGTKIPTEEKLCETYDVSRATVRLAVQSLRTEGLLSVEQGRGTFVRDATATADRTAIDRTVTRTSKAYSTQSADWDAVEPPGVQRVTLEAEAADVLNLPEGDAAYLVTRLLAHTPSGARARQTILIPVRSTPGTPLIEPDATITAARAYTALSTAHGPLEWTETVTARQPAPDERATLHTDTGPLLVSRRITRTQDTHAPLMLETTTLAADSAELTFTIRPTRPAAQSRRE